MRRLLPLLAASFLLPQAAWATRDYRVDNDDWNGLSILATLAEARGFSVEERQFLDWREVEPRDVLFILYPTESLDGSNVAAFIRGGGRVLVADDFGQAHEVLARLGLLRRPAQGVRAPSHMDNDALPYAATRASWHPLAAGVDEILTNHPAVFDESGSGTQVFGFDDGSAAVVAGELGDGRFVALSDPSVLINGMLAFDGNAVFATNLVRWLDPSGRTDGTGRLIVLTQRFSLTGEPPGVLDEARPGSVNELLHRFGRFLDELNDYFATPGALKGGMIAAGVLVAGFAVLALFRPGRRRRIDGSWTRLEGSIRDPGELLVAFAEPGLGANFAYPAALLRETLEARLCHLTGSCEPLTEPAARLLSMVESQASVGAARALAPILDRLRTLPSAAQASFHPGFVSQAEFEQLHEAATAFEDALRASIGEGIA